MMQKQFSRVTHIVPIYIYTVKTKIRKMCGKNLQLWLPEFYRKNYGSNILGFYGFNLKIHLNTVISLSNIMLIYQPMEVLKSV